MNREYNADRDYNEHLMAWALDMFVGMPSMPRPPADSGSTRHNRPGKLVCQRHQKYSSYLMNTGPHWSPTTDKNQAKRLLLIDTGKIDHLIILNNVPKQKLKTRRWWFTERTHINVLPTGRLLVCLCALKSDNQYCDGCDRLYLRPKHPKFRRISQVTTLQDGSDKQSTGLVLMITSRLEADTLKFNCHSSLTQKDVTEVDNTCNDLHKDSLLLQGTKYHLTYNRYGTLTSTCKCNRWEDTAATSRLSHQARVTEEQEQQERSSDEEF